MTIEVENPYEKGAEFNVRIVESGTRNGSVRNPFNESQSVNGGVDGGESKEMVDSSTLIYSAFFTKTESIYLEPKTRKQILVSYLPLQLIRHLGLILFSNENIGEFIYHLEGNALLPEPSRTFIDEKSLDSDRVKLIKSNRNIKLALLIVF